MEENKGRVKFNILFLFFYQTINNILSILRTFQEPNAMKSS